MTTINLKKCITLVSYYSCALDRIVSAVVVDFNEDMVYVRNSYNSVWLPYHRITVIR